MEKPSRKRPFVEIQSRPFIRRCFAARLLRLWRLSGETTTEQDDGSSVDVARKVYIYVCARVYVSVLRVLKVLDSPTQIIRAT